MTAMLVETGLVTGTRLADGLLVQLKGALGEDQLAELRCTLLARLPEECRDVVVDAGEVSDIDFDALSIVFAAWAWAEDHGARFLLSRTSPQFEAALEFHGVEDTLPRMADIGSAPATPVIPRQRVDSV